MSRVASALLFLLCAAGLPNPGDPPRFRLAFGSCNRQTLPQPLWPLVAARAPDAWAWLGDIVYADHAVFAKIRIPATLPEVAAAYSAQAAHAGYAAFAAALPVVGVWDDHDMGHNDGGGSVEEAYRVASKGLLLDFLGEAAGSARRARPGAHTSYFLLPSSPAAGTPARMLSADRATPGAPLPPLPPGPYAHLILLDVRYSRDDFAPRPWAVPAASGSSRQDMLGEAQWQWLEEQLQLGAARPASFTIITSGVQVLPAGDAPVTEGWVRHPASQARLLALLALHAPALGRVIFLSGDVHFGELSELRALPGVRSDSSSSGSAPPPLFELTSSGMTHSWGGLLKGTVSWLLMNGAIRARVHGAAAGARGDAVHACRSNLPWGRRPLCYYSERNFGEVDLVFSSAGRGGALPRSASLAQSAAAGMRTQE
jgi:alkaline phosphatase D